MTRDEARQHWAKSGLSYAALTKDNLAALRAALDAEMKASGLIDGSFCAPKAATIRRPKTRPSADIRCHSNYFRNRQAVTFEPDGFIGFAGWADSENVQPILKAFCQWVDTLTTTARAA